MNVPEKLRKVRQLVAASQMHMDRGEATECAEVAERAGSLMVGAFGEAKATGYRLTDADIAEVEAIMKMVAVDRHEILGRLLVGRARRSP